MSERFNEMKEKGSSSLKTFGRVFCFFAALIVAFGAFNTIRKAKKYDEQEMRKEIIEENQDLLTEKVEVTVYDVDHSLEKADEIITYKDNYGGRDKIEDCKQIWGHNLSITKHEIDMSYTGTIAVGYEMEDVKVTIDQDNRTIKVYLPEAKILYNNIETCESKDDNNILNPIKSDEVQTHLDEVVKPKALEQAEERGIYESAEENAKETISSTLKQFEEYGYSIEFPINKASR